MICRPIFAAVCLGMLLFISLPARAQEPAETKKVFLDSMNLTLVEQGWRRPRKNESVDGKPLTIDGDSFKRGLGTHADTVIPVVLGDGAIRFHAVVGIDDEVKGRGSAKFQVFLDDKKVTETGVLRGDGGAVELNVDVAGAEVMRLVATDAGDDSKYDHTDWGDAYFVVDADAEKAPEIPVADTEPKLPIADVDNSKLGIHGARIVGTTPGRPFMFLIPATGQEPIAFSAERLPEGLSLNSGTGIISGEVTTAGKSVVELSARDPSGTTTAPLTIIAGKDKLALTPPMGWNSWNVWGASVDAEKIKAAADSLVNSGLAAHGYRFINIDDAWEDGRDAQGRITTNEKFPDMKALVDYVHSKGLKIGIYSSPGPLTCQDFEGSYQHELQDAKRYAEWGFDYLKYDWCSYGRTVKPETLQGYKKPYLVMRDALDKIDRDIVYSLCQYGMRDVWTWGEEVGGNLWRTTGDIRDNWNSMSRIGFSQDAAAPYAGPGHWNDPDMLVVGKLGWGPNIHPTNLTHNEQITHLSLWSLLAAPLLIGCDMTQMDEFTINLLSNDEVIAIDQDPLGEAARRRSASGWTEVWSRPLADGTTAVGLFNRGWETAEVTAQWDDINVSGKQKVRDVWQQKDLGTFSGSFSADVPAHGCVLVKVGTPE